MLFILTGEVRSGKTRWLQGALDRLKEADVAAYGVIAPGIWRKTTGDSAAPTFEKLGIDNVLLPKGQVVHFATRRDLLEKDAYDSACTQAKQLQLGWAISDEAVARVNAHFDELARTAPAGRGLLVVDELGRLEVERGLGLTEALRLLDEGPSPAWQHALVVARDYLKDRVAKKYSPAWGGTCDLYPGEAAGRSLLAAFREHCDA